MTEREKDQAGLDALFAAARAAPPALPPALAARMLADAESILAARPEPAPVRAAGPGWRAQLAEALGGWFGMGSLVTACAAGVWMGFAPPAGMPDPVGLWEQSQTVVDPFEADSLVMALTEEG